MQLILKRRQNARILELTIDIYWPANKEMHLQRTTMLSLEPFGIRIILESLTMSYKEASKVTRTSTSI